MSEGGEQEPAQPGGDDEAVAPTLQALLDEPDRSFDDGARNPALELHDPVTLLRSLERSGRFHRDRRLGRVYHPGEIGRAHV